MTDERGNDLAARDPGGPNRNDRTDDEQGRSSWWIAPQEMLGRNNRTREAGICILAQDHNGVTFNFSSVRQKLKSDHACRAFVMHHNWWCTCRRSLNQIAPEWWMRWWVQISGEDTSGITFLVMQRSLAFSLGSGDPSVNRDQNQRRNGLLLAQLYRTLHPAYIARLVELNHN